MSEFIDPLELYAETRSPFKGRDHKANTGKRYRQREPEGYYCRDDEFYCQKCGEKTPNSMIMIVGQFKTCLSCGTRKDVSEELLSKGIAKYTRESEKYEKPKSTTD